MDAKTLNLLVHEREAAFYDDRFLISYGPTVGRAVERELTGLLGTPLPRFGRALDVACGTGFAAIGLAEAGLATEVHATDLSPAMIERTRDNAGASRAVHLAQADGEVLPYRDSSFDLVIARGALHHLPDPVAGLAEMRRVLRPGGAVVVLAEPTPEGEDHVRAVIAPMWRAISAARRLLRVKQDAEHQTWEMASIAANLHTFTPSDLASLAEKAGFTDVTVRTASLAWVLALGVNYFLVGEFPILSRVPGRHLAVEAAATFDRLVSDQHLPSSWRHTVQAVMR